MMKIKIGDLAKLSGCQVVTIRYYEKEGLLEKPDRTGANYRLYGNDDVERLRFIRHCRHHGMKLSEIRELLAFKDGPRGSCDWINTMVGEHIANVEVQIQSLVRLKKHLEDLMHKCSGGKKRRCGIIESLKENEACPDCEDSRCNEKSHADCEHSKLRKKRVLA